MGRNHYDSSGRRIPQAVTPAERRMPMTKGTGGLPTDSPVNRITKMEETLGRLVTYEAANRNEEACHNHIKAFFAEIARPKTIPKTQQEKLRVPIAEVFRETPMDAKIANMLSDCGLTIIKEVYLLTDLQLFKLMPSNFGNASLRRFRKVLNEFMNSQQHLI